MMEGWRDRLRHWISERTPAGVDHDAEVERRMEAVLSMEVPSNEELLEMERRGELPPDDESDLK
jgi:hypothetical protein